MEDPKEIFSKIEGEVDSLVEMYNLAEKSYPYSNVHGPRHEDEKSERRNVTSFTSESPEALITQGSGMGFLFVYMMSRGGAKGLFDMS